MENLQLKKIANEVRKNIVTGLHSAKSGHPGGSLSAADMVTFLYYEEMNVDAKNPKNPNRDRFVLSKGHAAPVLYGVLAEKGFIPKEDIVTALDAIATPMSLFEPIYQEGQDVLYLMDQVKDKKNKEENWVQSLALQEAMQRLDERELNIIRLRFFEGKTQTEVADEIAISQAQVSRLEKNALKSMRHYLSNE